MNRARVARVSAPIIGGIDSVTTDGRRAHVAGNTYFSTANTDRRRTFLTDADVRFALRDAVGILGLNYPFLLEALPPDPANEYISADFSQLCSYAVRKSSRPITACVPSEVSCPIRIVSRHRNMFSLAHYVESELLECLDDSALWRVYRNFHHYAATPASATKASNTGDSASKTSFPKAAHRAVTSWRERASLAGRCSLK